VLVSSALAVYVLARWRGVAEYGVAFGVGVLSHPLVDAAPVLWSDQSVNFLAWPILPVFSEGPSPTLLGLLRSSLDDPYFLLEFFLLAVALAVWRADGYPGVELVPGITVAEKPH
jgi:hypothetical protein